MRKVILSLALLAIGYMNLDKVKSIETVVENKSELETIEENKSELETSKGRSVPYYHRYCNWYQRRRCRRRCHRWGKYYRGCYRTTWVSHCKCSY